MLTQIILTKILADQMQLAAVLGQVPLADSAVEICKTALLLKNANHHMSLQRVVVVTSEITDHHNNYNNDEKV